MNKNGLKLCPFCARQPKGIHKFNEKCWTVWCPCGAESPKDSKSEEGAKKLWNRRRLEILNKKEIVICSAVKTTTGKIYCGHRHGDCFKAIQERHYIIDGSPEAQGFITSKNSFVSREEGRKLQDEAGIKSVNPDGYCQEGTLYSEDLY